MALPLPGGQALRLLQLPLRFVLIHRVDSSGPSCLLFYINIIYLHKHNPGGQSKHRTKPRLFPAWCGLKPLSICSYIDKLILAKAVCQDVLYKILRHFINE
jgi:hypothetical protein